jgi:hypothetical protein
MSEDERFYIQCPQRKNQARISIVLCFNCEFVTGYVGDPRIQKVAEIGCAFPNMTRPRIRSMKRRKGRER